MKIKFPLIIILVFLIHCVTYTQDDFIINLPKQDTTLFYKGVVKHTSNRGDSLVHVNYLHYIGLQFTADTVRYYDLYESARTDTLSGSMYQFTIQDNGLNFQNEKAFLNFPRLAKILFMQHPVSRGKNNFRATKRIYDDEQKVRVDSNYYQLKVRQAGKELDNYQNVQVHTNTIKKIVRFREYSARLINQRTIEISGIKLKNKVKKILKNDYLVTAYLDKQTGLYDLIQIKKQQQTTFQGRHYRSLKRYKTIEYQSDTSTIYTKMNETLDKIEKKMKQLCAILP